MVAVGKPFVSLANRRGPRTIVRFAAVSPTFGRLFEGTYLATAGQTLPRQHFEFTAVTTVTDSSRLANKS